MPPWVERTKRRSGLVYSPQYRDVSGSSSAVHRFHDVVIFRQYTDGGRARSGRERAKIHVSKDAALVADVLAFAETGRPGPRGRSPHRRTNHRPTKSQPTSTRKSISQHH